MTRYLVFFESHPHQILPADWSKEDAQKLCDSMNAPFQGRVFDEPYWFVEVRESGEYLRSEREKEYDG